ncbi:hypothetical protein FLONG3_7183 [Fusarium longipes]|uniref:Apple domain-containing protein n=1 Tax=Fusarium longipes TaxID=694270 RepID=A0A395SFL4_9HYPO|nr:hypothetical protein FLONG3_7183 [Fusarium longipes]
MKFITPLLIAFISTQVNAECVDGHHEVISPGYTVEYTCNKAKLGDAPVEASSESACAEICRDSGRSTCTFNARLKKCIVAKDDGKEVSSPGSVLMTKVDEPEIDDPFPEDPFLPECEDEMKACLAREKKLKAEYEDLKYQRDRLGVRYKNALESNCPSQHTKYGIVNGKEYRFFCARHHETGGYKEELRNIYTMADCVDQCSSRSWCNHILHGISENNCRLFESPKVSAATLPGLTSSKWNSAVKK